MTADVGSAGLEPVDLGWGPATETERALADARASGDQRAYFGLLSSVPLYLPGYRPPERESTAPPDLITADLLGQTYLLAFTSERALVAGLGDHANASRATDWEQLRAGWPHAEWKLAVNPGLALDAYLGIEAFDAARRGDLVVATESELLERFAPPPTAPPMATPPSAAEVALALAVEAQDLRAYVDILFDLEVLVPTVNAEDLAPKDEGLDEGGGWWLVGGGEDDPVLAVFTSAALVAQAFGSAMPTLTTPFAEVVDASPAECTILVNPGSPLGVELDPEQLRLLPRVGGPR